MLAIWQSNTPPPNPPQNNNNGNSSPPPSFAPGNAEIVDTKTPSALETSTALPPLKKPIPTTPSSPTPSPVVYRIERQEVSLGVIYFNTNEYFLDAGDRKTIASVALLINGMQAPTINVEGNTDIKKGVDNVWLSKARAEAVANLLSKDVNDKSVAVAWYASTRPAVIGLDKQSLAKNRRVEIFVVQQVKVPQTSGADKALTTSVSRSFNPIEFNRNEYFLDAGDRQSLVEYAQQMEEAKCLNISVVGTRDAKRGGLNETIAMLRAKAVAEYLNNIDGRLKVISLNQAISNVRQASISCTN
jgi:outer membrane protein OmpA-like peptidoglycan-associated protein